MQLTTSVTVDVDDDVLNEIACDLITTAVEGGIRYWASTEDYRWGNPALGHSHETRPWTDEDQPYATVVVHDDEDATHGPFTITAKEMIEAIRKLVAGDVKEFHTGYDKTYRTRLLDVFEELKSGVPLDRTDYDFDADDADNMMQIACFGETVYG